LFIANKGLRKNEQIRVPQVRLINEENVQIGVVDTFEALTMAREVGADLVEVSPLDNPPVCRIMDFGKWLYNQKKKGQKSKAKQHNIVMKEVRIRPKIESHDQIVKMKKAREFLEKGCKVQFTMLFRGREMVHMDMALDMLSEIAKQLEDLGKIETPPRRQGKKMTLIMAPSLVK